MRFTIRLSDHPDLAEIGWVAGRRGNHVAVVVSTDLPRWRQEVAPLEAITDGEYALFAASLPLAEQERRAGVAPSRPGLSDREALIAWRSALGRAGLYEAYAASLPEPEQRRRYIDVEVGALTA